MIAIHNSKIGFHERWIYYCEQNNVPFKLVNCYSNDIIAQLQGCDALMWHHEQGNSKDLLFAKGLLFALEQSGIIVFPDFKTNWHFDDKVGQKYLLEAIGAPLVSSFVSFNKKEALDWAKRSNFPKVFKLRGGAGSANVKLAKTRKDAKKLIKKAFGEGFCQYDKWGSLKERWRKYNLGKVKLWEVFKGILRFAHEPEFSRIMGKEIGYAYFQEFIPNNDHDIRVIVIDDKAFALKRMVRKNDFRASGSGLLKYDKENFDEETIMLSFEIADKLNSQCLALDYIYFDNKPLIVEISYGYVKEVYYPCVGYWDRSMNWHEGTFNSQAWMVESVIKSIALKNG